ncbi:translesion DNA synthesis-associated protein ImuA [Zoogloea sp. 1C4]|uniref:translesion DNA synthesis-associated protein ImuA n=1 Tax=Zoogloea sp. 1C4 TaxID=2570190 RepID=UPI001291850B|nr:translesion DNA synthesis-associated protein ImuA [Zoogloea sp. 1C4]
MAPPAVSVLRSPDALQHLVWRGDQVASAAPGIATGHAALDAVLPGKGWPVGALTEILVPHTGVGELGLILPLLQRVPERRWAVCIAPPGQLYAPALSGAGIPLERLLLVDAESPAHARWAARQSLNSHSCAAVVMWLAEADNGALRRLQLAAEESATTLILIRPATVAGQPSPAVLRLALTARDGGVDVRVLKRRGPQLAGPVAIDLPRLPVTPAPSPQSTQPSGHAVIHALVRPLPARSAPAGLRTGAG